MATPHHRRRSVVQKRREDEIEEKGEEKEKKEKEENDKKKNLVGRSKVEQGRKTCRKCVTTTMQFGTPLSFLQSSLMQISSRQITIINNYYYQPHWRGGGGQGQRQRQGQGQGQGQDAVK